MTSRSKASTILQKSAAWGVHVFTATGIMFAFLALLAIVEYRPELALWMLAAAVIVDSLDGTLARRVNVKEHTPFLDGATLDNLIDYITWTFLPLFWAYLFLDAHLFACIFAAMASSLGFSRTDAKTDDLFFLGFPSYWNFLILYLYLFDVEPVWSTAIIIFCGILVFIPMKWIYPSRTPYWQRTTMVLSGAYFIMVIYMLIHLESTPLWVTTVSLFFPIYYVIASLYFGHIRSNQ